MLSQGTAALEAALSARAMSFSGRKIRPRSVFGKLYDALDDYLADDQFVTFRDILRQCIFNHFPLESGVTILGQSLPTRRYHSPLTAASEIGIGPALVEKFLVDIGVLAHDDSRPIALRIFEADLHADLLAELPTLVGPIAMQEAMGATKAQLNSLRQDRVLVPRIKRGQVDSPWRLSDGIALIEELFVCSIEVHHSTHDWEDIQNASKRKRLQVGAIIRAVRSGTIPLGRIPGTKSYRHFVVPKSAVDELARNNSLRQARPQRSSESLTAASFARRIGMRADGWFHKLFEAGHVSASWRRHPVTNIRTLYMSDEDIEVFNRRFVTPTQMQAETKQHSRTCLAHIRKAGISPFAPDGQDYGSLFLREQVDPVLHRIRLQPQNS